MNRQETGRSSGPARLSRPGWILLAAFGAAFLAVAVLRIGWIAVAPETVLETGLAVDRATQVAMALASRGIECRVVDGGSTILVSRTDIDAARQARYAVGAPVGGEDASYYSASEAPLAPSPRTHARGIEAGAGAIGPAGGRAKDLKWQTALRTGAPWALALAALAGFLYLGRLLADRHTLPPSDHRIEPEAQTPPVRPACTTRATATLQFLEDARRRPEDVARVIKAMMRE